MLDKIKLLIAALFITGGIAGFYYFSNESVLYRVLGLLLVSGVGVAIALRTQIGAETWGFGRSAMLETRKVVWPTRKETIQTTLIVIVMVVLIGIMLWLFDMFLLWAVRLLTGQGG